MKKAILLSLLALSLAALGAAKTTANLTALMHLFYGTLMDMKPYMVSYDEFKKPENKAKIQTMLKGLEAKIDSTEVRDLKAPGFNVTYNLLAHHLRDTSYLFEKEIYDTAWNNLRATTQFCIACHDRLPKGVGKMKWPFEPGTIKPDPASQLREADFLYIGHQFDQALDVYNKVIRTYTAKSKNDHGLELEDAYQRKIAYFARIQRDPKAAIASLKEDLKNESLPLDTKKNIESWIYFFDLWSKEGKADPSLFSNQRLVEYARDIVEKNTGGRRITVSDPYVVNLLRVSGLLYERVYKQPKSPETQDMLYLLGKCERDLAPIRNYSLSDVYFKECILQDPKKPVAKKCFSDYELSLKQKFRNGTSEYIEAGLEELRKMTRD